MTLPYRVCSVEGCEQKVKARALCETHYVSALRRGVITPLPKLPPVEQFWSNVDQNSTGCWEWQGPLHRNGYGHSLSIPGIRTRLAHRVAWALNYGEPQVTVLVCHRCDNRKCCRPDHLFLGTAKDNTADMMGKGRDSLRTESHHWRKLSNDDVREIKQLLSTGKLLQREIAKLYGVTQGTISAIKCGINHRKPV